jgi:hypothetical protein
VAGDEEYGWIDVYVVPQAGIKQVARSEYEHGPEEEIKKQRFTHTKPP